MDMDDIVRAIKEGKATDSIARPKRGRLALDGSGLEGDISAVPMPTYGKDKKFQFEGQEYDVDRPKPKGRLLPLKKGGKVKSASARADGCAQRGKTRGKMV